MITQYCQNKNMAADKFATINTGLYVQKFEIEVQVSQNFVQNFINIFKYHIKIACAILQLSN